MKKIFTFLFLVSMIKLSAQCSANFTYTLGPNGSIMISNTSVSTGTNPSFYWNFGDNTTSNLANPTHTYANSGTYSLSLQLSDSSTSNTCYSFTVQTITITSAPCLLSAGISTNQSTNGTVLFYNASSGNLSSTTYTINYGDNTSSSVFGPHTYTAPGNYVVSLTAQNSPACVSTNTMLINVTMVNCSLVANFSVFINQGTATFSNSSTGTSNNTMYYWTFGNNNQSYIQNPGPETYLYNGNYPVTLVITDSTNATCTSSLTQIITITNAPCYVNSSFNMHKDSTQVPNIVWDAIPNYPTNVVSAIWNWGDNTTTNALYPSHTYSATGFYNICLTVSVACGSQSTTCMNTNIFKSAESMAMAVVHVVNPAVTGIKKNISSGNEVIVFPNPSNGDFYIRNLNGGFEKVIIYDQLGKIVLKRDDISWIDELRIESPLSNGVYFLQLNSAGNVTTKKIVINK